MKIILFILLLSFGTTSYSGNTLDPFQDPRYCGEPKRNPKTGDIVRSKTLINLANKLYPLPPDKNPDDFEWNHDIPLVCGGCNSLANITRIHKKAKRCRDDWCQDRHEQVTMCPKSFHK